MKWRYAEDLKTELWYPQEEKDYPVAGPFAKRLITDLCSLGFDPAHSQRYLDGQGMSHSFGYVYHRIMTEKVFPIIPVNINTYYPPNQVTPLRATRSARRFVRRSRLGPKISAWWSWRPAGSATSWSMRSSIAPTSRS